MHHSAITIIGNTGSGKSTIAAVLAEELDAPLLPADELFKTNPFFQLAVKNRKRWSLASDIWFLLEREKLLQDSNDSGAQKPVIIDSGLAMSWVYAHSRVASQHFTADEWELYQQLFEKVSSNLSLDPFYIYLRANTDQLLQNIKERGRDYELRNYSTEYLQCLNQSLEVFISTLPKKQLLIINVTDRPEQQLILKKILTALTKELS